MTITAFPMAGVQGIFTQFPSSSMAIKKPVFLVILKSVNHIVSKV